MYYMKVLHIILELKMTTGRECTMSGGRLIDLSLVVISYIMALDSKSQPTKLMGGA